MRPTKIGRCRAAGRSGRGGAIAGALLRGGGSPGLADPAPQRSIRGVDWSKITSVGWVVHLDTQDCGSGLERGSPRLKAGLHGGTRRRASVRALLGSGRGQKGSTHVREASVKEPRRLRGCAGLATANSGCGGGMAVHRRRAMHQDLGCAMADDN